MRRPLILSLIAVVCALALSAGVAYGQIHKNVRLEVDGKTIEVSTFASSVGQLLREENIKVNERDLVAPSPGAELRSTNEVVVRHAKRIPVEIDGLPTSVWTTAITADEAIVALGRRGDDAQLVASRSDALGRTALNLGLTANKEVTVSADGKTTPASADAGSVDQAISAAGITLGDRDKVQVTDDDGGVNISVIRVTTGERTKKTEVAFEKTTKKDANLIKGTTKIVQAGVKGESVATYSTVLENGKEVRRALVSEKVTKKPVTQITAVGTKVAPKVVTPPAASTPSTGSKSSGGSSTTSKSVGGRADSLNWAGLAACESGGNPRIVSSNGLYYGLYQFTIGTWRSVGGSGLPNQASPAEQTLRAKILYNRSGAGPWPVCGARLFR